MIAEIEKSGIVLAEGGTTDYLAVADDEIDHHRISDHFRVDSDSPCPDEPAIGDT